MSQIRRKFVEDNAINGAKSRLDSNEAYRSRNAADSADVDLFKLDSSDVFTILRELSMDSNKIINVADGTAGTDAVNLAQVQAIAQGLRDPKDAARLGTTAALPANSLLAGVLTADANGALPSIDGVAPSVGDRILVKDESVGADVKHGLYEVTALGDGSNPWVLTRTSDADEDSEVTQGMNVPIVEGSINAAQSFYVTTADPITVDVTPIAFAQFGVTLTAGDGIDITGSVVSVRDGAGLGFVTGDLVVQTDDDSAADPDKTTKIVSDEVVSRRSYDDSFVLGPADITNQYIDLDKIASRDSIHLQPLGGPVQRSIGDYTILYTGGTGGKTRISFAGDIATGGNAALVATDELRVKYLSLDY